jgi:hypothetical protein
MAGGTYISSGLLTTGGTVVYTGRRFFGGASILTDGTNAATVTVYDSTTTSGLVVCKISCAGPDRNTIMPIADPGVRMKTGLTVLVEGTNAQAVVYHK